MDKTIKETELIVGKAFTLGLAIGLLTGATLL